MKTCSRALRTTDWGRRFTFQQDNAPKHTDKTTQEWLWDKSLNVLEWHRQSPDLDQIKHLWRPVNSCAATLPIKPERAWEDLQRRMGEFPKYRCAKLVASHPRRFKAVIAAKGASTKGLSKGSEYLCKCDISGFFFLYICKKNPENLFLLCHYVVLWCHCGVVWCHCGVLCVDWKKNDLINFRIRL